MTERFRTISFSDPAFEHEGLRVVTVRSAALGRRGDLTLWVPESGEIGALLILLHGVYGSHWSWSLEGGVHRIAARMLSEHLIRPLVIAMPSDGLARDGSAWLPWPGEDVERWIVDEVPAIARLAAPALRADARMAIAGLSMGGYGALRLGAKYADRFSAFAAHSAITEIEQMAQFVEEPLGDYLKVASVDELRPLSWLLANRDRLPPLRMDCGADDPLIDANRFLHRALRSAGIAHQWHEYPGGHEWTYWQQHIGSTLRFIDESLSRNDPG